MQSGLYERLVKGGYLVSHSEVDEKFAMSESARIVIKANRVYFSSHSNVYC